MLDLIWKSQVERLGISLKDMNKCSERQGKFEQEAIRLEDCFRLFSDLELLDAENYWHCPRCKKSVEARKKMELFRVPPVLILHLKRFKSISYMLEKVSSAVDCPLKEFDLSPFLAASLGVRPIYDLFATVCHIGATLQSGHYISYCLNKTAGSWIECNDSKVRNLPIEQVPVASAYMLFYRLRT
jgi:ubiquitin C-terminal hydrolase